MACPYFYPVERLNAGASTSARLPLGDPYDGVCHAGEPFQPDRSTVVNACNLGYARRACARFPRTAAEDAVRFGIAAHSSDTVRLCLVTERDHQPGEIAMLEYRLTEARFACGHANRIIQRQAQVFLEGYLRRKRGVGASV